MASFGIPLFAGIIETLRQLHGVSKRSPLMRAMLTCTLVTIAAASMQEDMTPFLVFGDYSLRYLYLHAEELTTAAERAVPNFKVSLPKAFKHLTVALNGASICLAWARENVHPYCGNSQEDKAVHNAVRQQFCMRTFIGNRCMCAEVHEPTEAQYSKGETIFFPLCFLLSPYMASNSLTRCSNPPFLRCRNIIHF